MKKKCVIETHIRPMPRGEEGKYMVQITYVQGGAVFTHNNAGQGMELYQAEELAYAMRDHIKSDE